MGMGGQKAPDPITPGEAAQAAVGTAAAGEQMAIANQPVEQYANLSTTEQLGPAETQTQQALANQAAYQSASAQQDIQSRLDPMAYAQRQMRLGAATNRLGQLYGTDPTAFSFRAPGAYSIPGSASIPALATLSQQGAQEAANLSTASVNSAGGDPTLMSPQGTNAAVISPRSYFQG
jgi:hypothetical protein